jgi:long-chain acyl-CoA synthetase
MTNQSKTLATLFLDRVAETPGRRALRCREAGTLRSWTWSELASDVDRVARGLRQLGVEPGDRVAQLSENRREWILADLAIQRCHAIHVPIHAPLAAPQVLYQIRHSGARVLFVSGADQQAKIGAVARELPDALTVVRFSGDLSPQWRQRTLSFHEWLDDRSAAQQIDAARAHSGTMAQATQLATILYTSGTTGQPKGVMLSHHNVVSNAVATVEAFGMDATDVRLSFLPLSHIFARTCDLYTWIVAGSQLDLATSRESVIDDCQWSQPTIINGVPYFYDRLQRILREQGQADRPGSLRTLLGGRIRFCCSGGAALPDHLFDFFESQQVPILQGYGLTETSPVISLSAPQAARRGSSGRAIGGIEVAITGEGEIVTRGPTRDARLLARSAGNGRSPEEWLAPYG